MNSVWLLYKKDMHSFFRRPLFYMVAGVCCLLWSPVYIYAFGSFLSQMLTEVSAVNGEVPSFHERVIVEFMALVNILILLFSSSISMKLITEEKKNHTMTLLFVSPLRSWQIVLSKYLSGITVAFGLIFIGFLYPLTSALFGKLYWPSLLTSYFGLMMFACVYIAIGLFMSTLTSSLVMAFIMALIANLSLWFMGVGGEITSIAWLGAFFDYVNFETMFKDFSIGIVRFQALALLMSVVVFFLLLSERALEASRWK